MVPRVDFYILDSPGMSVPHMACRITEKAWKNGHKVFIHTGAQFTAPQMDDLLWTFRAEGFVPHTLYDTVVDEEDYPVLIGASTEPEGELDVLINLGNGIPESLARCQRIIEVVANAPNDREVSRQRYRLYREKGCELHTYSL